MIYKMMISRSGRMTSSYTNLFFLNNNNNTKSTWKRLREMLPQEVNKAQVKMSPAGALNYCQIRHLKFNSKSKTKFKILGTQRSDPWPGRLPCTALPSDESFLQGWCMRAVMMPCIKISCITHNTGRKKETPPSLGSKWAKWSTSGLTKQPPVVSKGKRENKIGHVWVHSTIN